MMFKSAEHALHWYTRNMDDYNPPQMTAICIKILEDKGFPTPNPMENTTEDALIAKIDVKRIIESFPKAQQETLLDYGRYGVRYMIAVALGAPTDAKALKKLYGYGRNQQKLRRLINALADKLREADYLA